MKARKEIIGDSTLILGDCWEILPTLGRFDAVVTDPPYGIGAARNRDSARFGWTDFGVEGWDDHPPELAVLSAVISTAKFSIIWGGDYFSLPPRTKWLIWDKGQSDFSLADAELAWCSWPGAIRRKAYPRALALRDGKEHQTQKALAVMAWCVEQLPERADTILDPFMGSGTTGVACINLGRTFTGIEIHEPYFDIACRRIEAAWKQPRLFEEPKAAPVQEALDL